MTTPLPGRTSTLHTKRWKLERLFTKKTGTIVSGAPAFGGLILLFFALALVAFLGHRAIERTMRAEQAKTLRGTVQAAKAGVELWLEQETSAAQVAARDPHIRQAATCLSHKDKAKCDLSALGDAGRKYAEEKGERFFLVDQEGRILSTNAPEQVAADLGRALSPWGKGRLSESEQRVHFLPPLALSSGAPVSILFVPLAPGLYWGREQSLEEFTRSFRAARIGESGETYAVDRNGRMISQSRFSEQLRLAGLLGPNEESSVLRVEIRDPGVNLAKGERTGTLRTKQPLTKMAASLTRARAGVDVTGYRDYRGVRVLGAWKWLPDYEFGIATELDESEALESLRAVENVYFIMLGVLACVCLGSLGMGAVAAVQRRRATAALARLEKLGNYQIERKIGEGGMGKVYLAHHEMLRRPTALKIMAPQQDSQDAFRRFELEAKATSELTHPNTVSIFDFGRAEDGTFYYAMEYLVGMDLEDMVDKEGPLPDARVLSFLHQAAGSLEEAHAKGLIHRDIKPSNLFACTIGGQEDFIKVLDFGVAKATDLDATRVTRSSTVIGTPEYMAPEMFDRGSFVTAASDLYSLGAVGYFLLTGKTVFPSASMAELYAAHLSETPAPPSERLGRTVDPHLESAILACLRKDPAARPPGARALRATLEQSALYGKWKGRSSDQNREFLEPPFSGAWNVGEKTAQ
jgi:hypothetical protein